MRVGKVHTQSNSNENVPDNARSLDRRTLLMRSGAAGLLASSAGFLAACGGSDKTPKASGQGQAGAVPKPSGGGTIAAKYKNKKIGVIELVPADENQAVIASEMRLASKTAGLNWDIQSVGAQGKTTTAATALDNFVTKKFDAVMMIVVPASAVGPQLARAEKAGIPVFGNYSFGQNVPGVTADYSAVLPMDASALGLYIVNTWLAKKPKGPIKVGLLDNTDIPLLNQRSVVFKSLLALFPQFKVIATHNVDLANLVADSSSATRTMLSAHPDLDVIWANYAPVALPAASAVSAAGRGDKVAVYGHVSGAAGIDAVRSGTSPLKAISWVDFIYNAWGIVDLMLRHFAGKPVSPLISQVNPVPVVVIDKDHNLPEKGKNYESFGGSFKQTFADGWKSEFSS
jgi:ABC-type sugar transport system substrate-binding protein